MRELIVFAPHNLLSDPPFSHLDLIVCRNVLIYLQRDVQQDVISLFHYALNPNGLLVIGTSESIDQQDLFLCEDKDACVFRKRNVATRESRLPVFPLSPSGSTNLEMTERPRTLDEGFGEMHERIFERYGPPSVLVNHNFDVVHISASAGRFLQFPSGEPTTNVIKLAAAPLRLELRALLHLAQERGQPVHSRPQALECGSNPQRVILRVHPATDADVSGFLLVLFEEVEEGDSGDEQVQPGHAVSVRELEAELDLNRQRLQASLEEYESSREEMQASNEELQSANEELRSTLEELETSKEELQSMNEELATLNQENRHRVEELSQLSSDLQNLLAATEIATLFLDRQLRIVRFTPQIRELFNIRHTDRGRPLSDFTHKLGYPQLLQDASQVLERLISKEGEVRSEDKKWYLTRILPYRAANDRIDGVVITFIDISERKQAEESLRESEEHFRVLVEAAAQAVWEADAEGVVIDVSPTWRAYTRQSLNEWLGYGWIKAVHPEDREYAEKKWRDAVSTGDTLNAEFRLRGPDGNFRWTSILASPIRDMDGKVTKWVAMNLDITERKEAENALRAADRRKDHFLATLAHELRNPLAPIIGGLAILKEAKDQPDKVEEVQRSHGTAITIGGAIAG